MQQLLASALPRRMATGVSAGGLGKQENSSAAATPTTMIPDKVIVQHGMTLDFEEDD